MDITNAPLVDAAVSAAAAERERRARLWEMDTEGRLSAYRNGELTLFDCLDWASRFPSEPPRAPDGEYMFIAVRTPEWLEDEPSPRDRPRREGREL